MPRLVYTHTRLPSVDPTRSTAILAIGDYHHHEDSQVLMVQQADGAGLGSQCGSFRMANNHAKRFTLPRGVLLEPLRLLGRLPWELARDHKHAQT